MMTNYSGAGLVFVCGSTVCVEPAESVRDFVGEAKNLSPSQRLGFAAVPGLAGLRRTDPYKISRTDHSVWLDPMLPAQQN